MYDENKNKTRGNLFQKMSYEAQNLLPFDFFNEVSKKMFRQNYR